jgi:hypothetical protein
MLDAYVSERVKELTQGMQTPTTIKPSALSDFPLALVDDTRTDRDAIVISGAPSKRRGLDILSVAVHYFTPASSDIGLAWRIWPHLALAIKVAGGSTSALSLRMAGGPIGGMTPQQFLTPDGMPAEASSHALAGALFELGLQVRGYRLRSCRPSLDTGILIGAAGYGVSSQPSNNLLLSVPLRGRLSLGSLRHALAIELGIAADFAPVSTNRYTGAGASFTSEPRTWGLQGTLGVAYEYKTKDVY